MIEINDSNKKKNIFSGVYKKILSKKRKYEPWCLPSLTFTHMIVFPKEVIFPHYLLNLL